MHTYNYARIRVLARVRLTVFEFVYIGVFVRSWPYMRSRFFSFVFFLVFVYFFFCKEYSCANLTVFCVVGYYFVSYNFLGVVYVVKIICILFFL